MKRKNQIDWSFKTISIIFLSLIAGCQMAVVNSNNYQSKTETTVIENNSIKDKDKDIKYGNICRVKYHPSHSKNHPVVIEGKLGNGNKYPIILDTGASVALFVNDTHINENNLVTRPFRTTNKSAGWGTCHLPELNMGEITLLNWPCFYQRQHAELQFCGMPVAKDKSIILGLPTLQEFKYVVFNNIRKEVEFSAKKVFEPRELKLWSKYSFRIEEFLGGNTYLFVTIPIAGEEVELQLDTGSGKGLAIQEELWERIQQKIQSVKFKQGKELYPYIGLLECKQGISTKLNVGNRPVKNAKVSIFPEDSPLLENCEGLLGMQYFQDTVIVLDFERNLMWVMYPQSQQQITSTSL